MQYSPIHFWIYHWSWNYIIRYLYYGILNFLSPYLKRSSCLRRPARSLCSPSVSLYISLSWGKKQTHCEIEDSAPCRTLLFYLLSRHPNDTCMRWTHISFSSWSRVDCSCRMLSWPWASISSWLVWSSSRANSSLFCFSFTFSALVMCCSLWSSWYCCSN